MTDVTCCEKCCKPLDDHPLIDVSNVKVLQMCDRHPKWQRVEPGTVIPAGQPIRTEWNDGSSDRATEQVSEFIQHAAQGVAWFIDSSWKPPLVLPTAACVIRAKVKGPVTHRVLFGHPNPGEDGMTFCRAVDGLRYGADEIESFEVLWMDEQR